MDDFVMINGLYGSVIDSRKMVGYCHYHCAAMTVKTMKRHECLKKQCNSFERQQTHDFWRQHEQRKEWRKANKAQAV